MSRRILPIILFCMLLSSVNAQDIMRQDKAAVAGTVIDNCGKPVPNARVYIFPPDPPIGTSAVNNRASTDGRFRYMLESLPSGETEMFLYVTSQYPPNAEIMASLTPPFYAMHSVDSSYRGRAFRIRPGEEINFGDVPIQIYYGTVVAYPRDGKGNPIFNSAEDWEYIGIRIRDLNGRTVAEGNLPPASVAKAVRVEESAIAFALPEGVWQIEIAPEGLQQKWPFKLKGKLLTSEMFFVRVSNAPLKITLRPKSGK